MFNEKQIESYQNISAPSELKQKVFAACQHTKEAHATPFPKQLCRMAPIAACLILCFTLLFPNSNKESQPFYLMSEGALVSSEDLELTDFTQKPSMGARSTSMIATASLEPMLYTISLQTNPDVTILSAEGEASLSEDGVLIWTVQVPENDMVFQLTLQSGNDTYLVPLTYYAENGSFTISCQPN